MLQQFRILFLQLFHPLSPLLPRLSHQEVLTGGGGGEIKGILNLRQRTIPSVTIKIQKKGNFHEGALDFGQDGTIIMTMSSINVHV